MNDTLSEMMDFFDTPRRAAQTHTRTADAAGAATPHPALCILYETGERQNRTETDACTNNGAHGVEFWVVIRIFVRFIYLWGAFCCFLYTWREGWGGG